MRIVNYYWVESVFDIRLHWVEVVHEGSFEVPDSFTVEDIYDLAKRKDVIIRSIL
jgi:hypothetical protein